MDKEKVQKALDLLHGVAEALRDTRLPVREKSAIARLITLADSVDECKTNIEEGLQDDDGNDQQG